MTRHTGINAVGRSVVHLPQLIALVLLAGGVNACTHLAFQPSRVRFVDPTQLGITYQDVSFSSADGTALHGWFFPAQTTQVKGTFVQFHGNAENISTHFASLLWVTEHGYNLFTFDYRGYGQSAGSVSMPGAHEDVRAAIAQARQLSGSTHTTRLILYGQSLGGVLLLRTVPSLDKRHDIVVVIADSSFPSYRRLAREKFASHCLTFPLQPLTWLLVSDRYAPEPILTRLSPTPLLVIHGDQDSIVPWQHGQRLYDQAKMPKWFWKLQGVGHIQSMAPQFRHHREALLDFLAQLETQQGVQRAHACDTSITPDPRMTREE